jgi:hypothetical protein
MTTLAQQFAAQFGMPVIPTIAWEGSEADSRELDDSGLKSGLVTGGVLDGKTVSIYTAKHNCGAWEEEINIAGEGYWRNGMNGCWQCNHQREEESTFSAEVEDELHRLGVL